MILAVPVNIHGQVDQRFGKATHMAVAEVAHGELATWQVHPVGWDVLHDQGEHGTHHARIVRFLRDNGVERVVYAHMGPPMLHTIDKMGLQLVQGGAGSDAQHTVLEAAAIDA